ncbi:hypothetical protein GENT5_15280 [Flavobacterium ammoniigenes]|jgi:predicted short-subunit dehydrogenase-like oxidoreductase (DUF2520 family)|uniref:DUF2520 domain-containing protein n=1 Tax=Flavobacterium ammoniigenes TaxID=1751095 RepID=A0ABM7V6N2_9FLAO|nr:DUF2520 domain-containing protein [Flavobacterium ammoniigenes]BDB55223.1 hypothetical protein GENT5_15280 [Flavobacterium ammoniigenes]
MIKVSIIGSGNVAQHLIQAFQLNSQIELVQVVARDIKKVAHLLDSNRITSEYTQLQEADLYIIAVSDDAIAEVSSALPFENRLVAHTSGTVALDSLNSNNRRAVFYPLQSFSKDKPIDFKSVPICLEAENEKDVQILKQLAHSISNAFYEINSEQRKALHVAAVFVNNFVNYLYQMGNEICDANAIPFEILKPLIQETANKIATLSPKNAQTGPAKRNDLKTIAAHEEFLKDENQAAIYKLLTQSLQNNGKKL